MEKTDDLGGDEGNKDDLLNGAVSGSNVDEADVIAFEATTPLSAECQIQSDCSMARLAVLFELPEVAGLLESN